MSINFFPPRTSDLAAHGQTSRVPVYREAQPRLVAELRRARRYERALSVVLVGLQAPLRPGAGRSEAVAAPAPGDSTAAVFGMLGAYLCNVQRECDIVTAMPDMLAYAAFLPETDRRGAEQALARFQKGFLECTGLELRGGIAAFPGDGLTIEDVLDCAYGAWRAGSPRRRDDAPSEIKRRSHG